MALGKQDWQVLEIPVFVLPSASGSNRDPSRLEGKSSRLAWFRAFARLIEPREGKVLLSRRETDKESAQMGPVEQAIGATFRTPVILYTLGQRKPFVLERIDHNGIVLLLGEGRNYTPLSWNCLEGIIPFLCRHPGWVPAGGTFVVEGEGGTLDEYLKDCISRQTSRWVAVVLEAAGVVRVDKGPPLRVRLTEQYMRYCDGATV